MRRTCSRATTARAHALSKSAIGYGGMVRLLRSLNEPVIVSRRDLRREEPALIIFTPESNISRDAYVKAAQLSSRTLVVMPKWTGGLDPRIQAGSAAWSPSCRGSGRDAQGGRDSQGLTTIDKGAAPQKLVGAPGGPAEGLVLETGPIKQPADPVRSRPDAGADRREGRMILARRMPTETYFLADPDLLNTMGLKDVRTARGGVGSCG
jgi:hypothetical protein